MMKVISILFCLFVTTTAWSQNTIESIRQRYNDAKEYARMHTGSDCYDGADFGEYYHVESRQWLPGTGGHIDHTYLYYGEKETGEDVIYAPHYLKFATKQFNFAAREYTQEFLYDADGKIAFIYAFDPMTLLYGDESYVQYEYRLYFSRGRLIKAIVKRRQSDDQDFQTVYEGTTVKPIYRTEYDNLLAAARALYQLFTDIEKEAYNY